MESTIKKGLTSPRVSGQNSINVRHSGESFSEFDGKLPKLDPTNDNALTNARSETRILVDLTKESRSLRGETTQSKIFCRIRPVENLPRNADFLTLSIFKKGQKDSGQSESYLIEPDGTIIGGGCLKELGGPERDVASCDLEKSSPLIGQPEGMEQSEVEMGSDGPVFKNGEIKDEGALHKHIQERLRLCLPNF